MLAAVEVRQGGSRANGLENGSRSKDEADAAGRRYKVLISLLVKITISLSEGTERT